MAKLLDQISVGMTNASRTVSQKVKNLNDITRLTNQVKAEESNIQKNLIAIGQKYYQLCKDNPDEDFRAMTEAIQKSEMHMEALRREMDIVRSREPELMSVPEKAAEKPAAYTDTKSAGTSVILCPHCGRVSAAGSLFCADCGCRLTGKQPEQTTVTEPQQTAPDTPEMSETVTAYSAEYASVTEPDTADATTEPKQTEPDTSEMNTAPQAAFCPYCGQSLNTPGQRFCSECGREI